ncbi:MAG: hypothetical protein KUG64_10185 [Cycloclasticus sp.]|nr:hypothetical protein [Cycloclasticus sp.]
MRLWESAKAKWRGEKRIKGAERGRLFIREGEAPTGAPKELNRNTTMELVGIKIIRADGSEEEIM